MSKRFYYDEFLEEIYDEQIDDYPSNLTICGILNDQQQRIAELEKQLKNAIVPKFKIWQVVWFIDTRVNDFNENKYILTSFKIEAIKFDNFDICYEDYWGDVMAQRDLFATKEEAQAKLQQMKGNNYE